MRRREGGEPRQEPQFGHRLDRDDPHPLGPAALAFRDPVDLGEDALHLLQVGLAAAGEAHAAVAAVEQRDIEMLLQHPDAVGDGGRGDVECGRGAGEALVAGRGLEEAQTVERGEEQHVQRRPPHGGRVLLDGTSGGG